MEKKELINKITDFSSDLMEKHFPKGECKERGQALVFNAEMIVYVSDLFEQELDKAREEGRREALEEVMSWDSMQDMLPILNDYLNELSKLKDNK
jgi:hypothetical protein